MAEDFHDKTEEPTPKKLAEARKKGYVAKSQDLTISVHLIICILIFFFFSHYMFGRLSSMNAMILNNLNYPFASIPVLSSFLNQGLYEIFLILLPLLFGALFISIIMNLLQTGAIFSTHPLMPKWSKLNIFNPTNYEHTFGGPALVKIAFGLLRLQIVMILSWIIITQKAFHIFNMGKGNARDLLAFIQEEAILVGIAIAVGYFFVGILDLFYQKWHFNRKMRMSKREVKDEMKQVEGDLNMKQKVRSTMRSLAQANAINQLPYADILITDNNRYAIALAYKPQKMSAPLCLCKGARRKAAIIRELAEQYGIPVVEDTRLARKLFREIDSGSYVTSEFYPDVASSLAKAR